MSLKNFHIIFIIAAIVLFCVMGGLILGHYAQGYQRNLFILSVLTIAALTVYIINFKKKTQNL